LLVGRRKNVFLSMSESGHDPIGFGIGQRSSHSGIWASDLSRTSRQNLQHVQDKCQIWRIYNILNTSR